MKEKIPFGYRTNLDPGLGLERTQDFANLPDRAGHLNFPGHVLPDRTNTGHPYFSKIT